LSTASIQSNQDAGSLTEPNYFWVNNRRNYAQEISEGYLLASIETGKKDNYRELLALVKKGDVVFVCHNGMISDIGIASSNVKSSHTETMRTFRVPVKFHKLASPVDISAHKKHLIKIRSEKLPPISSLGTAQQGSYISQIALDMASFLMAKAGVSVQGQKVVNIDKGASGRILNLKDFLADLTAKDVLDTLKAFSLYEKERFCYKSSTDYDLVFDGYRYPPKAVLGFSAKQVINRVLLPDEFSGGVDSECFSILQRLGFYIEAKKDTLQKPLLFKQYKRKDICHLFEPNAVFTPKTGRWGIQGIVKLNNATDDLVFMVSLEKPHEGNPYHDYLSEDGVLSWQTQSRTKISDPFVQRLIAHDPDVSNIHLFLRSAKREAYSYLGLLDYQWHDEQTTQPVHFEWRLTNINAVENLAEQLGSELLAPAKKINPKVKDASAKTFNPEDFAAPIISNPTAKSNTKNPTKRNPPKKLVELDWAVADERNRTLGDQGEQLVMKYERNRLIAAGRADLAAVIERISLVDSAAGYDIQSFDLEGNEIFIEVKSTKGGINTPFYISANEVATANNHPGKYYLYRLHSLNLQSKTYQLYVKQGSVEEIFDLEPVSFKARVK